jgi:hypothetical protein
MVSRKRGRRCHFDRRRKMLAKSPMAAQRGMSGLYGAIPDAKTFRESEAVKSGRTISVRAGIS